MQGESYSGELPPKLLPIKHGTDEKGPYYEFVVDSDARWVDMKSTITALYPHRDLPPILLRIISSRFKELDLPHEVPFGVDIKLEKSYFEVPFDLRRFAEEVQAEDQNTKDHKPAIYKELIDWIGEEEAEKDLEVIIEYMFRQGWMQGRPYRV